MKERSAESLVQHLTHSPPLSRLARLFPKKREPMRRLAVALAVLLSFATARTASAADKIAYVDVQRVISEVEEGKAAKSRLRTELESKRAELDKKQKELEQL